MMVDPVATVYVPHNVMPTRLAATSLWPVFRAAFAADMLMSLLPSIPPPPAAAAAAAAAATTTTTNNNNNVLLDNTNENLCERR